MFDIQSVLALHSSQRKCFTFSQERRKGGGKKYATQITFRSQSIKLLLSDPLSKKFMDYIIEGIKGGLLCNLELGKEFLS